MSTEAEARDKWCPMVRTGLTAGMAVETRCIGSKCMMWRWRHPQGRRIDSEHGHCGLAGQEA